METRITLYSLTGRMYELMAKAENEELTNQEVDEQYNELCQLLQQKSAGIIGWYRNMDAGIAAVDAEIKRLTDMKARAVRTRDNFKEYVYNAMNNMGFTEISTEIGKLKIAKNPASVDILDIDSVPDEYVAATVKIKCSREFASELASRYGEATQVEYAADKKALLQHFKDTGELVDGVMINTNNTRLDIK